MTCDHSEESTSSTAHAKFRRPNNDLFHRGMFEDLQEALDFLSVCKFSLLCTSAGTGGAKYQPSSYLTQKEASELSALTLFGANG